VQVHRIKTHRAVRCVPGSRHAGLFVYNTVFQYIDYTKDVINLQRANRECSTLKYTFSSHNSPQSALSYYKLTPPHVTNRTRTEQLCVVECYEPSLVKVIYPVNPSFPSFLYSLYILLNLCLS
jgi:hypothetical protein